MECKAHDITNYLSKLLYACIPNVWKAAKKIWQWSSDKHVSRSMYGLVDCLKCGFPTSQEKLEFAVLDHCMDL